MTCRPSRATADTAPSAQRLEWTGVVADLRAKLAGRFLIEVTQAITTDSIDDLESRWTSTGIFDGIRSR